MKKNLYIIGLVVSATALGAGVLIAQGAPNISTGSDEHWGWSNVLDYIDFLSLSVTNVEVGSTQLSGYADSDVGEISLDCATTSVGNICGTSDYRVTNDGAGNLEGWGWNDNIGWVSFCGGQSTADCPGTTSYQVTIDENGDFFGFAWNDIAGWIQFNCADPLYSDCTPSYKVATSWRATSTSGWVESVTFDTEVAEGAQINSIMWKGAQPSETEVRFQLAVATSSSGPWDYDWSTLSDISPAIAVNTPASVSFATFPPSRYFRYRVWLFSDPSQTATPRVEEIIINWSK